jgi:hypothetical protein
MLVSRDDIPTDHLVDYGDKAFLKYSIKNYLDLMPPEPRPDGSLRPIEAIAPQIALINAINNPKYRFIVAVLARRTGKSFISNAIGQLVTLVPGSNVLIMAPNYSLSNISWDIQRKFLNDFGIELRRSNAKDKVIELENGSQIRMGSVTQADSVVGRSYDLIIFDECALNNDGENVFNIQLRPTLDKPNSKAIFISTPRGKNWFETFYKRGSTTEESEKHFPTWCSILSTWNDNPRAIEEDVEDARKSMSTAEFSQEYECSFIALQGRIYEFNPATHVGNIDLEQVEVLDVIAGLDIGFKDMTALCVIVTDGENFYVVDEYQDNGKTTAHHAGKMQAILDKWKVDFIYIDSAAQQTKYDLAMDFDISCTNAKKSILDGIGYVGSIIEHDRLFISKDCHRTVEALENYRWDERPGLLKERAVHDDYSHMSDAIRYALYTHSINVTGLG